MEFLQITINNKTIYVRPEATILQACEAAEVDVPRFCYHEKLSIAGNCRMCLVEVIKSPKPVVACARPVSKGRVVFSDTPLVRKARESVLEFLLLNHPLDCPICDQGGECDLQDEALTYGSDRGRFFVDFKRSVEDKECGPIVKTIITRCIHCTRCVRFSAEIAGNEVRGSFGRGEETEIGTYIQSFIKTELSGNLVDLCPVGALTSKPYAYKARSWEVARSATIDLFDAVASDIQVYTRNQSQERIMAVLPIKNGLYSENWISDRTRYAFDGLYVANRLCTKTKIQAKGEKGDTIGDYFNKANTELIFGPQVNLETLYAVDAFRKRRPALVGTRSEAQVKRMITDGESYYSRSFSYSQTTYTANLLNDFPYFYSLNKGINDFVDNPQNNIIRIGSNVRYEASLLNTRLRRESKQRGATYITVGNFNPLAYGQKHKGNSYRSIIGLVENRRSFVKEFISQSQNVGIYMGVNALRNANSKFIQQIVRQRSKYFFVKNNKNDRFGYIHSSVGSLAFSHMNFITPCLPFSKQQTTNHCFIGTQTETNTNFFSDSNLAFSTHFKNEKNHLAIPSFYETSGHILSLGGEIRKHNKVVTSPANVYDLATYANATICNYITLYYIWGKALSKFKKEFLQTEHKNEIFSFQFNPFSVTYFFHDSGKLILFSQSIKNFYIEDQISSASITRAECALFLKQDTNKSNFLVEKL